MPPELQSVGRYDFIRRLGSGGMGTVFEARDRSSGARLAIKALHQSRGSTLYGFKHEFRVLSELSHPFLVRVGELFEEDGRFYLTMELVDGTNFLDYVRPGSSREGPPSSDLVAHDGVLDAERLRLAVRQLAGGIIALHASGVIHRDVKPENVLVTGAGRVVLLDFGIAIHEDRVRAELAGTVAYMAPEQIAGLEATEASDWYAVGVVLYEALTGRLPHAGVPAWATARRRKPMDPRGPGVPDDLGSLCMDLLEPDADRRPDERAIAGLLDLDVPTERRRASFRSRLQFARDVFVNRQHEITVLHQALAQSSTRGCSIVRIVGESGIGKTALLRRWFAELHGEPRETLVLSGRCYERETLPYRGVDDVVDSLARSLEDAAGRQETIPAPRDAALLGQVFPVLQSLAEFAPPAAAEAARNDPQEARRLAFHALRDLLFGLALRRRLVVHVDDAQWIDPESIALLSFLVAGDQAPRMLLAFTQRPVETDPLAGLVTAAGEETSFTLETLDANESRLLAIELLRGRDDGPALAAAVAATSGGHPLFIHELIMHREPQMQAGSSLEDALAARIARIEPASRRLLEVIAVASAPLRHDVARDAAELDPNEYPWVLSGLRSENLVTFGGLAPEDTAQPYHDRIREFVAGAMGDASRRRTHARLAEKLEVRAPNDFDALAHHFFEGGVPDKTARYARQAAERALEKFAFEHAARFFQLALRVEANPGVRASLQEKLGEASANAGRGVEAADSYLRACELVDAPFANELRRRAGEQLFRAGHVARAMVVLKEILSDMGLRVPRSDVAIAASLATTLARLQLRLLRRGLEFDARPDTELAADERLRLDTCWTVATGLGLVHHLRATDFQARSLLLALQVGAEEHVLKSAALLSVSLSADATLRRIARRLMDGARELAARSPTAENAAWLDLTTGITAMGDWDFQRCVESCARAEAGFKGSRPGVTWEVVSCQAFLLWAMVFQGNLAGAGGQSTELLASARARGDRHAVATLTLSPLHLVGLAKDESERVRADCHGVTSEWPDALAPFQHMCAEYVLSHVDLYEGNPQQARAHVRQAWRMLRRSHLSRVQFQQVDLLGLRARVAVACGAAEPHDRPRWILQARRDALRLERIGIDAALGLAALVTGAADRLEGRRAQAEAQFDAAAARFEALGMRLHSTLARLARAIADGDDDASARAEADVRALGVVRPDRMLRVWIPGV